MASAEIPATPNAYYDWLVMQLQGPRAEERFLDGTHLFGSIAGKKHEGLPDGTIPFCIDDYGTHYLEGVPRPCQPGLHRAQLRAGHAWFAIKTYTRQDEQGHMVPAEFIYDVFRPEDVDAQGPTLGSAILGRVRERLQHELDPGEAVVYNRRQRLLVQAFAGPVPRCGARRS